MDIRTKLVFALVAVSLGSMLALGAFLYMTADRMIGETTRAQLEGLAESRAEALESIIEGWGERVQLIASRTQLRMSLRDHNRSADPEAKARISRILADASASVRSVAALAVYDRDGRLVATHGPPADSLLAEMSPRSPTGGADGVILLGVTLAPDGLPHVGYSTPLILDGEFLGDLFVFLIGYRLVDLTSDYTGLGLTGEVLIVEGDGEGAHTLHPVRHVGDEGDPAGAIPLTGAHDPGVHALTGEEGIHTEDLFDYRGEPVWAATRFLTDPGWGLVVKFDTAEKRSSIVEFRDEMVALALSLAGISILVAVLLGFRFANPMHNLAKAANRIRSGELDARATVTREDEIGLLADTFNQMADELEQQVTELHQFQKFFDVSLDMLCIAGTDGYFKRINPAFERVLGWSGEELLSRPFVDLVHPDDVEATQSEIGKLAQGIPTISFVNRFRCADGGWRYLRWTSYPETDTGLLYAVAREIKGPQDG